MHIFELTAVFVLIGIPLAILANFISGSVPNYQM